MLKSILLTIAVVTNLAIGQSRISRPIQIQANFAGALLSVAGNAIADETVDDLAVNKWLPGLSVCYHLNNRLYLGYSLYPSLDMTLKEDWGFHAYGDGTISLDHKTGIMHSLAARYSPFNLGLYFSVALTDIGAVDYSMKFRRKSDTMRIGLNDYATDVDVTWNSEHVQTLGFGLGYNKIFNSGLSLNIGLNFPKKFPDNENIEITTINSLGLAISDNDKRMAETRIQDETFYGPILMFMNIGYNLSK